MDIVAKAPRATSSEEPPLNITTSKIRPSIAVVIELTIVSILEKAVLPSGAP
jgi:hypothetical protein